jgi:hypothetical protein
MSCFYTFFVSIFFIHVLLLLCILNTECLCTCQACQPRFRTADFAWCFILPKDITTVWHLIGCVPDRDQIEPFIFFVLSFALVNVANIYIFMILYDCCLHSSVTKLYKYRIFNVTCNSRVGGRLGNLPVVQRTLFCRHCSFKRWLSAANCHVGQAYIIMDLLKFF